MLALLVILAPCAAVISNEGSMTLTLLHGMSHLHLAGYKARQLTAFLTLKQPSDTFQACRLLQTHCSRLAPGDHVCTPYLLCNMGMAVATQWAPAQRCHTA